MKNCPYCVSAGNLCFKVYSRTYNRCTKCDLIYRNIEELYENVLATYRDDYFARYSADQTEGNRAKLFSHALNLIEKKRGVGRLLDVGTGCGFFLIAAQQRGWQTEGIEPSVQSVEVARNRNNLDVFNGTLREYEGISKFDVITFINVLEHSVEPWKEVDKAGNLLKSGGIIFIRFPNGFLHTRIYRMAFKCGLADLVQRFLVFHQFCFTPKFISRVLTDKGFSKITILNSPPSEGDPNRLFQSQTFAQFIKRFLYLMSKAVEIFSCRKVLLGTSLEVMAVNEPVKRNPGEPIAYTGNVM